MSWRGRTRSSITIKIQFKIVLKHNTTLSDTGISINNLKTFINYILCDYKSDYKSAAQKSILLIRPMTSSETYGKKE